MTVKNLELFPGWGTPKHKGINEEESPEKPAEDDSPEGWRRVRTWAAVLPSEETAYMIRWSSGSYSEHYCTGVSPSPRYAMFRGLGGTPITAYRLEQIRERIPDSTARERLEKEAGWR